VIAYLVVGHAGEYPEDWQWTVAAYTTREQAEEHCRKANEAVVGWRRKSALKQIIDPEAWDRGSLAPGSESPPWYEVEEVPLVRHVDEYAETLGSVVG